MYRMTVIADTEAAQRAGATRMDLWIEIERGIVVEERKD